MYRKELKGNAKLAYAPLGMTQTSYVMAERETGPSRKKQF